MCHMPHPSHSPQFDHLNNICLGQQKLKHPIMQFRPHSSYFLPSTLMYLPQHTTFSNTFSLLFIDKTKSLQELQTYITVWSFTTPTCFDMSVPSSRSLYTKFKTRQY
jgi:hypothetical protein